MDDDDEFDFEIIEVTNYSVERPMSRLDLIAYPLWMAETAFDLASKWMHELGHVVAAHGNHKLAQANMAEQVSREIETLTGGDNDG
jgi:hypothetical protein